MTAKLFVQRLRVLTGQGLVAYDEHFHQGVNIIRGDNSSGKSTIVHLLLYALGGEFTRFVPEAARCSRVMVQVALGEAVVTLSRPLDKDSEGRVRPRQGMTLHWGTLDDALAGRCRSLTLGYATTGGRKGYSALLFSLLGLPEVQADGHLTMHQLLRLLYVDQDSPTASLFVSEPFDTQARREAVGDLLLGLYDGRLYEARLSLHRQEAALADVRAVLRSLQDTLPPDQRSAGAVRALMERQEREVEQLERDLARLRDGDCPEGQSKPLVDQVRAQVARLARECSQAQEKEADLKYDIQDIRLFLSALSAQRDALGHSMGMRRALAGLHLTHCPECLSPLPGDVPQGACRLCRSPLTAQDGPTLAARMREELTFQMQESEQCLAQDEQALAVLTARLRDLRRQHRAARQTLDRLLGTARGSRARLIEDLCYRQGLAQGRLQHFQSMLAQAEYYERQEQREREVSDGVARLRDIIDRHSRQQEQRRAQAEECIQRHAVYFLHHDRECQRSFAEACPQDFHVDFAAGTVWLRQPHARYSASSSFLLRLVAHYALLLASLDIGWMRYPRFILADNMEDKGMEVARARQFQETLVARLEQYPASDYQVIFTTSCIPPSLDTARYVVGDHYRMGHKCLRGV